MGPSVEWSHKGFLCFSQLLYQVPPLTGTTPHVCSKNIISLIFKIASSFGTCTIFVLRNFPDPLLNMVFKNEGDLGWVWFKTMDTNDTMCGRVPVFVIDVFYTTGVTLFIANLYFVWCRLREKQEKNVSKTNGFWQAHDLNIVTWEGKTYSDIMLFFCKSLLPSHLLYVLM